MTELMKNIIDRKSVRTYDGRDLNSDDRRAVEEFIGDIPNPFDIPVKFVLLDAKEKGLSSPVLSGEKLYVAGLVEKKPYADVAYGYSFEKLVLFARSLGIGTVWIGGTMKRERFEEAAGKKENEMMPCVSPLGYPAEKRGIKEVMMRKGIGADNRYALEKLIFDGSWNTPLADHKDMEDCLEMVRWAPSAVNKQPWRLIKKDNVWHFYEKKDKGYVSDATGDLQKIDVGIALCHFCMALEEKGISPQVSVMDPGIAIPENVEYIASVTIP